MADAPAPPAAKKELAPVLVPKSADDLNAPQWLRLLVMGFSKVGKSCTVVATAPAPVYIINSDPEGSLAGVRRFTREFSHNDVHSSAEMHNAIETARYVIKHQGVKTVVWDTMSGFSNYLEAEAFQATLTGEGNEDGRRAWPIYRKHLRAFVGRLLKLKAHVIVNTHWLAVGGGDDDGPPKAGEKKEKRIAKTGEGIVPMLGGAARAEIPSMFQDIVFMEKIVTGPETEERVFVTGMTGVFGPGMRSIAGNRTLPADVEALIKQIEAERNPTGPLLNARSNQRPRPVPIHRPPAQAQQKVAPR